MTVRTARVQLSTGITLNVAEAGDPRDAPPVILLHGFPESHRTWRGLVPLLADDFRLIMPDQRGFGGVRPAAGRRGLCQPTPHRRHLRARRCARRRPLRAGRPRLGRRDRLGRGDRAAIRASPGSAIVNSPHPGDLPEEPDRGRGPARRQPIYHAPSASRAWRRRSRRWASRPSSTRPSPATSTSPRSAPRSGSAISTTGSQPGALTAMLNWYRASKLVVPPPGVTVPLPDLLLRALPEDRRCRRWSSGGCSDTALLPLQLDGLDTLVDDLTDRSACPMPAISRRGKRPRRWPRRSAPSSPATAPARASGQ